MTSTAITHRHDHENVLAISYTLAQLYIKMGKLEEAQELLQEVMKGYRYLYGETSFDTLEVTQKRFLVCWPPGLRSRVRMHLT